MTLKIQCTTPITSQKKYDKRFLKKLLYIIILQANKDINRNGGETTVVLKS